MTFIKNLFLYGLLAASVALAGYVYVHKEIPCRSPIQYSLGTLDSRFGISKAGFLSDISDATHIWENAYGKDLFEYTAAPQPGFSGWLQKYFGRPPILVNLVYDERQLKSDENKTLVSEIGNTKATAAEVKAQFTSLQAKYTQSKAEYQVLLDNYKKHHGDFATLEQKRIEVNTLADSINALVKKYNTIVGQVNQVVDKVNQTAGQEFEEGQYVLDEKGERINIYEFSTTQALVRVIAHELGHAIGLDHNPNPQSIMYYLNNSSNMTPTVDDLAALKAVCVGK
jgi:predicted Zn-dependent protease